jgi:hypothetical protein
MASADALAVCRAGGRVVPLLSLSLSLSLPLDAGEEKPRSGKQEEGRKEGRRRSIEGAQK